MKRLASVLLALLLLAALGPSAWARHARGVAGTAGGPTFDYYIAASGCSDANAGTSVGAPWCITSLQDSSSNDALIAGKSVGLLPGTYNLNALQSGNDPNDYEYPILNLPAGTSGHPTYIGSSDAGGHYFARTAELSIGASNATQNSVIGQDQDEGGYWTIDGIVIDAGGSGTSTVGFNSALIYYIPNATNGVVTIENSEFRNVYTAIPFGDNYAAIIFSENLYGGGEGPAQSPVFTNNYFHDIYRSNQTEHTHAIESLGMASPTITYNTFTRVNEHIDFKYDTPNANISYNYFGPTYEGLALRGFDGNGMVQPNVPNAVHHNVFDGVGYIIQVDVQSTLLQAINFYSNTIYNTAAQAEVLYLDTSGTTGGVTNNAQSYDNVVVNTTTAGSEYGNYAFGQWSLSNYNYFAFASLSSAWYLNGTAYSTLAAWKGATGSPDAGSLSGNATSIDFAGSVTVGNGPNQFELGAGSPALSAGRTGGTSGGSAINMGAWDGVATQIGANFASYP